MMLLELVRVRVWRRGFPVGAVILERCRHCQGQDVRAGGEQGRKTLASLSCHSELLLVSAIGKPQVDSRWQRKMNDAVYKFLRYRMVQRGAEAGSWGWKGNTSILHRIANFHVPPTPSHNNFPFVDYSANYEAF